MTVRCVPIERLSAIRSADWQVVSGGAEANFRNFKEGDCGPECLSGAGRVYYCAVEGHQRARGRTQ